MLKKTVLLIVEAKPGKESEVEQFFKTAQEIVSKEAFTSHWYAFRISETKFGVFDAYEDEDSRQGHLNGPAGQRLVASAPELFSKPMILENGDLFAAKAPGNSFN